MSSLRCSAGVRRTVAVSWPGGVAVALVSLLVLAGTASAQPTADIAPRPSVGCNATSVETGRRLLRRLDIDGVERSYVLDVPESIRPTVPVPLILDFHGFGHSAAGVWKVSKFGELAARDGFIMVYPDGLVVDLRGHVGSGWEIFSVDGNRDLAFVIALLEHVERTYCIDRARVFATGFSNGAWFSSLLACSLPERIAAIAPVGGGRLTLPCEPGRGIPVLLHHGRKDERVPVGEARRARDAWIELNRCREHVSNGCERHGECRDGVEVVYCEDDSTHTWPVPATRRIWEFFRKHPLKGSRPAARTSG
jgi:polyhydroxybutyrate depolymerase